MKTDTGARYEIIVNGVSRTHRDDLTIAIETAEHLRLKPENKMVAVKDTVTGQIVTRDASKDLKPDAMPLLRR
jgi:hypothetical protein